MSDFLPPPIQAPIPSLDQPKGDIPPPNFVLPKAPDYPLGFDPAGARLSDYALRSQFLAQALQNAPDKFSEKARQDVSGVISSLFDVPYEEAYKNPWQWTNQLTSFDPRKEQPPLEKVTGFWRALSDSWNSVQIENDIAEKQWRASESKDPAQQARLLAQASQLKKQLPGPDVWADGGPRDAFKVAAGITSGLSDMTLGWIEEFKTEKVLDYMASTKFPLGSVQANESLMALVDGRKRFAENAQDMATYVPVPEQGLKMWALGAIPLMGKSYEQLAGRAYSDMLEAGVDPNSAKNVSRVIGVGGDALNLVTLGVAGKALMDTVGKPIAKKLLDTAVMQAAKRTLMDGGATMMPGLKSLGAQLATTGTGRLLKYTVARGVEGTEMAALSAVQEGINQFGYNLAIELGKADGDAAKYALQMGQDKGLQGKALDEYVLTTTEKLHSDFGTVMPAIVRSFKDNLPGALVTTGALGVAGKGLSALLKAQETKRPVADVVAEQEAVAMAPKFNPATDKIDVAQTKATVKVGEATTEFPITRENGAIRVTGDVAPEIAPHLAQKLADAGEGQRIEPESPALRAAVENLNPDAPVIRARISDLESELANARSDEAGTPLRDAAEEAKVQAIADKMREGNKDWTPQEQETLAAITNGQSHTKRLEEILGGPKNPRINDLEVQLQSARDELVTPTETWKAPRPEMMTPAEFSAHQESVMASRAGLGNQIHEQLLKAAPNVTEEQAGTFKEVLGRMQTRHADQIVIAIVHDEGLDGKNGAAEVLTGVMRLGKDATFATAMHELMHLSWKTLREDEKDTFVKELGLEVDGNGELTRAGHEKFADSLPTYMKQKEGGSPLMEKVKQFIRDLVDAISGKLSDKAMKGFDELLGESDNSLHDAGRTNGPDGKPGGKVRTPSDVQAGERPVQTAEAVDRAGTEGDASAVSGLDENTSPSELFSTRTQSEHERLIQKALADGKYVPDHVIEVYLEKPWALEEWNKRHPESQRALEATALTSESAEDFVARVTDPLYPEENIPESIKGLAGEDLKTELADYWERTTKKDSAVEFKQTLKNFTPEEITAAYRDALVQGSRREGALKTELGQARKRSEFNARMETEARVRIKGLEEALTSARAEAKATASKTYQTKIKSLENALTDARAEHELTLRHLADARRERATMEKLARSIMRPVGTKTIDVHSQAFLKAIQNSIDPRFRRESTLARRIDAKKNFDTYLKMIEDDGFLGTGFKSKESLERIAGMAEKKSLDQFTLQDLADVANVFNQAYQHGKKVLEARIANRKAEEVAMINDILTRAEKAVKHRLGTGIVTMQNIEKVQGTVLDVAARYSLDPHRFFDLLDGGHATWNGPFYDSFIRTLDKAEDARIEGNRAFQAEFDSVILKNGFKNALGHPDAHEFFIKIDVEGRSLYVQEAMDVYLKWMNDKSRAALIGDGERTGNRYTQEFHDKVVDALTPGQKAVADWILEYYNRPETKDAYFSFVEENQNYTPVDEPNYTRIRHLGFFKERSDTNIRLEMAGRSMGPMAVLPSGAAINRVEISEHHQTPLQLGIIDEVFESVDFNNRYMNFLEPIRKLEAVYSDRSIQELVQDKMGNEGMARIRSYIDLAKNPNMGKNPDTIFRVMRAIKSNISKAYMGFNPKTVAMQIAAPLLYAGELENPAMLLVGIAEVNKGWNDTFRKIEQLSPQLWARLNHGTMRQILASTDDTYLRMLGDKSMAGIGHADTLFAAWGWWAVFKEKSEKINIKTGKQNSEAEAAKMADEAMNRTQQPTFMKDKAELFGNNEALSWMTMFQGPLNKVFNQIAYDMPRGPGGFRKAATLFGVLATGYVTWMVASGKPAPTDDKEWAQLVAGQIFGAPVPIIGSTINNMVYGYDKTGHFTPAEPIQELLDAGKVAINASQGKYSTEEAFQKFIDKAYGFYALANGIPLVEVRRAFQVTKDAMDGKGLQIQNLMGKDYGK